MDIKRGNICFCKFHGVGSVQNNNRPCVILSNDKANYFSPVVTVAPITSKSKQKLPTHVAVELNVVSCIMLEQITTVDKAQLYNVIGMCDQELMDKIESAVLVQLAIRESNTRSENRRLKNKLLEYKKILVENSLLIEKEEETEKKHVLKPMG